MVCVLGIIIISIYSICYWSLYGVFLFCFYSIGSIPDILQLFGLEHGKAQKAPNRNKRFVIALICLISTSIRLFDICSYLRNLYIS